MALLGSLFSCIFVVVVGYRLFFMLRRFPIESKGRRKKLHEVFRFLYMYVYDCAYCGLCNRYGFIAGWVCDSHMLHLLPHKMHCGKL